MQSNTKPELARRFFSALRHRRTSSFAHQTLAPHGVDVSVQRSSAHPAWTWVTVRRSSSWGFWKDFHAPLGHYITLSAIPLDAVPALLLAPGLRIDPQLLGHDQDGDFVGEAAAFLRQQTGPLLSLSRMLPAPGGHPLTAPMFTGELAANWLGTAAATVTLTGPGRDALAQVELEHLTEQQARAVITAYAHHTTR